ncbi:MAG: TonB-dependent receptor, partial [Nevskiales bacterium]
MTDPAGALVPGVRLQITHRETSFAATTVSDQRGLYRFPVIPVGAYELTARKEGFAQVIYNNVAVAVGARVTLPIRFALAPHAESVTITEGTPLLEKTRSSASSVVDSRSLSALPINGRDYAQFVLLTPNVTRDVRGGLSFSGLRGMNSVLVDGADADDSFWGQPLGASGFDVRSPYQFSQEAIREFQVNSNNYSAELGRAGGAVINAVTKSGGNQFHGAAFWYYRDQSLNANSAIDKLNGQPKLPFHVNQFGANLGGPLVKDRLFFFFNFDGQRTNSSNSVFLQLPASFQLSSIAEVRGFQQFALDFLASRAFSWSRPDEQNDFFTKFDGRISPRHRLSGFWNHQRRFGGRPPRLPTETFEHFAPARADSDQVFASWTATVSDSIINVARLNFVDSTIAFLAVGINPEANIFEGGQLVTSIGRAPGNPQSNRVYRWQGADTVTWQRGRHTFKAGGDLLRDRVDAFFAQNFSGAYRFRSLESFGRSLAGTPQYLVGDRYVQSFSTEGRAGPDLRPDIFEFAGFLQDEWRIRPSLALNLGVRYDLQRSARPPARNPSPVLEAAGLDTASRPEDAGNVAPRVDFAWSPRGRLVVRAGYGIFFGRTIAALNSRAHFYNDVNVVTRTLTGGSPSAPFIPFYPNSLCGLPGPEGASPSCAPPAAGAGNAVIMLFVRNYSQPYTQQANLGFELELFKDTTVAVNYAFVKGTHLPRVRDVNLRTPTISTAISIAGTSTVLSFERYGLPRPLAGFDRVMAIESSASSVFHGLTLEVKKRFSHHFQANLSYTLG